MVKAKTVAFLLSKGIDIKARNKQGETAFDLVKKWRNKPLMQALKQ